MKKILCVAIIALLLTSVATTTAMAKGNCITTSTKYSVCNVKTCTATTTHKHNKKTYAGHSSGDGHTYHNVCSVANCARITSHTHNGVSYFAHHFNDGTHNQTTSAHGSTHH